MQGKKRILIFALFAMAAHAVQAQDEWLATLDYNNLSVNRIKNIPGVTWVAGNSTFDQNKKRFFFQGGPNRSTPFNLFTINAISGAVINNPISPPPGATTQLAGIQYDNASDTLYALYLAAGSASFCSVDPATGVVNSIALIPGYSGYLESCFDSKDHLYIVNSGNDLLIISAATGQIVHDWPNDAFTNMQFDNSTGKLYEINTGGASGIPQFDSVSISTGTVYVIANLPPMAFPELSATVIDENAGKYFFIGQVTLSSASGCVEDTLYALDINTGAILEHQFYPYAQGTGVIADENVIEFSMDNAAGKLYALNWYPPDAAFTSGITVSPAPDCAGVTLTFTVQASSGTATVNYEWQRNGKTVGTDAPTYSTDSLINGDSVRCILAVSPPCAMTFFDTTNTIGLTLMPAVQTAVSINASSTTICSGDTVLFTAGSQNGGNDPAYQWLVNGEPVTGNGDRLSIATLTDSDVVSCLMTSSIHCALPANSDSITMTVNSRPSLNFDPDTVYIKPMDTVALDPLTSGSVASWGWSPTQWLEDPAALNPVSAPGLSINYTLTLTGTDGCVVSATKSIIVFVPLLMPNAFTPNSDGRNDLFRIPPRTPEQLISFTVYNRWGERVFYTHEPSAGWDGRFNNSPQPAGAYVWVIRYLDPFRHEILTSSGTVMLIR